jgi:hypothetical protein
LQWRLCNSTRYFLHREDLILALTARSLHCRDSVQLQSHLHRPHEAVSPRDLTLLGDAAPQQRQRLSAASSTNWDLPSTRLTSLRAPSAGSSVKTLALGDSRALPAPKVQARAYGRDHMPAMR